MCFPIYQLRAEDLVYSCDEAFSGKTSVRRRGVKHSFRAQLKLRRWLWGEIFAPQDAPVKEHQRFFWTDRGNDQITKQCENEKLPRITTEFLSAIIPSATE